MLCKHKPAYFQSLFDFLSALKSTDGEPRALASFLALCWTSYDPVNQHYLGITIWICFLGLRSEDTCTQFYSANHRCSQTWSLTIAGLQSSCVASSKVKICHGCSVSNLCIVQRERRLVGDWVWLLWVRLKLSPYEHIEMFKCCYSNYEENSHSLPSQKPQCFVVKVWSSNCGYILSTIHNHLPLEETQPCQILWSLDCIGKMEHFLISS